MRSGGGKQKGASFEREVCKRLSLWVTKGKREDVFWRSAMSGGRATVGKAKGLDLSRQAGDITAVAPEGFVLTENYFLECKFYRDLSMLPFMLGKEQGNLFKFWARTSHDAGQHGLQPLLIARQNNMPTLVVLDEAYAAPLADHTTPFAVIFGHNVALYWFDDLFPQPKRRIRVRNPSE